MDDREMARLERVQSYNTGLSVKFKTLIVRIRVFAAFFPESSQTN